MKGSKAPKPNARLNGGKTEAMPTKNQYPTLRSD